MMKYMCAVWVLLLLAVPAHADVVCNCKKLQPSLSKAASAAHLVFVGKANEITATPELDSVTVTFQVSEILKGVAVETIKLWTSPVSTCGFAFLVKESYLVYALRDEDGRLSTNCWTRTKLHGEAEKELVKLRRRLKSDA